jgi:hypothetical protein
MGSKLGISVCPSSQQNGIFFMYGNFLDPEITILVWFQNLQYCRKLTFSIYHLMHSKPAPRFRRSTTLMKMDAFCLVHGGWFVVFELMCVPSLTHTVT